MNLPKTHPLNVSYLVVGLVFLGIAGYWALHAAGVVDSADGRWLAPVVLVVAGSLGLVAYASKGLSRARYDDPDALDYEDEQPAFDPYPAYDLDYEPTGEIPTHRTEGETR